MKRCPNYCQIFSINSARSSLECVDGKIKGILPTPARLSLQLFPSPFTQVMKSLLLTLGVHPVSRTIELRTAAAAVEELEGLWNVVSAERRSCAACGVTRNCCIGDTCAGGGASLGAWSVGSGSRNRRFAVMLEEGYAASAGDERQGWTTVGWGVAEGRSGLIKSLLMTTEK